MPKAPLFHFFNCIFWNDRIDINTQAGKQIFNHEVAHIREKHSYDKVFVNIILIFFWINPFFWLMRKELNIIHEFIADKKALEGYDTAAFAAMILQAAYPRHQFTITNNFYYSPLKRRLIMTTKNNSSQFSYASRLLVLALATLLFFAFTIRIKTTENLSYQKSLNDTIPTKQYSSFFADTNDKIILNADTIIHTTEPNKTYVKVIKAILVVNGKIESNDILKTKTIVSKKLTIHSGDDQKILNTYGAAAKNGVFVFEDAVIIDKPPYPDVAASNNKIKSDDKIFTKVEIEPSFPGGNQAWNIYIRKHIEEHFKEVNDEGKSGTCLIRFIVDTSGDVREIEALTMKETMLAKVAVNAVKNGPKWICAMQNNHKVTAYREQLITFTKQKK